MTRVNDTASAAMVILALLWHSPSAAAPQIHCGAEREPPPVFTVQARAPIRALAFGDLPVEDKARLELLLLKFWREPYEMTLFPDGRAIIKGTTDTAIARSLYARYVGS